MLFSSIMLIFIINILQKIIQKSKIKKYHSLTVTIKAKKEEVE